MFLALSLYYVKYKINTTVRMIAVVTPAIFITFGYCNAHTAWPSLMAGDWGFAPATCMMNMTPGYFNMTPKRK